MKRLILVEGTNDSTFIDVIIKNSSESNITSCFYSNSGTKTKKRDQETILLRKFCNKTPPFSILVKEEGGRYFTINLFINLVVNFLMKYHDIFLIVLFDHDGKEPQKEIENIRNDLKAKTSGKLGFEQASQKRLITGGLYRRDFSLIQYNGNKIQTSTSFSFVSFDVSLEDAVSRFCNKPKNVITKTDIESFASQVNFEALIN